MFLLLTAHCLLLTIPEFRTGIQRSDLLPRAYFPAALESFKKYKLRAKAGNLTNEGRC